MKLRSFNSLQANYDDKVYKGNLDKFFRNKLTRDSVDHLYQVVEDLRFGRWKNTVRILLEWYEEKAYKKRNLATLEKLYNQAKRELIHYLNRFVKKKKKPEPDIFRREEVEDPTEDIVTSLENEEYGLLGDMFEQPNEKRQYRESKNLFNGAIRGYEIKLQQVEYILFAQENYDDMMDAIQEYSIQENKVYRVLVKYKVRYEFNGGSRTFTYSCDEANYNPYDDHLLSLFSERNRKKIYAEMNKPKEGLYVGYIIGFSYLYFEVNNEGGCDTREHITTINNMKVISKKTTNNNCLFQCVKHFLPIDDSRRNDKNDVIRKKIGLEFNKPIKREEIIKVANYFKVRINLHNIEGQLEHTYGEYEAEANIILDVDHYVGIINKNYNMSTCNKCGKQYYSTHTCNVKRATYYQKMIMGENIITFNDKNTHEEEFDYSKVLHFDLETFGEKNYESNENNYHDVYAVGFVDGNQKEPTYYYGRDSMDKFMDYLEKCENKIINAYNGSSFDFFFLMNKLMSSKKFKIINIVYNNNQLKSLEFSRRWNREDEEEYNKIKQQLKKTSSSEKKQLRLKLKEISSKYAPNRCFDLCLFVMSSLDKACADYKIEEGISKGKFDHTKIKSFEDAEEHKEEVLAYLRNDVLSIQSLFKIIQEWIWNDLKVMSKKKLVGFHITDFLTVSSMAYHIWTNFIERDGMFINVPTVEQNEFLRKAIYGGRCHPVKESFVSKDYDKIMKIHKDKGACEELKKIHSELDDYIFNADITSLYPTAMRNYEFPVGKAKWCSNDELESMYCRLEDGKVSTNMKIGVYEISYIPDNTKTVVTLPKHGDNGGLIWDLNIGRGVYTSVDIINAVKNGYSVDLFHKGLYYSKTKNVFKGYIDLMFKYKQDEDNRPKKERNGAKRSLAKLMMNSLYGKMLQKPYFSNHVICEGMKEVINFRKENTVQDYILHDDKITLFGTLRDEHKHKAIRKPTQLGAFVLAYSRQVMYDAMKDINQNLDEQFFTYTDTDSLHIHSSTLDGLKQKGWFEVGLGKLSNDCDDDGKIIYEHNIGPKNYMYVYINNKGEVKEVMKCKGIPRKYLTADVYEDYKNRTQIEGWKPTVIEMNGRLKKDGMSYNGKDIFKIRNVNMTRTFGKTQWSNMHFDGKNSYYPHGYYKNE